jgi:hypothetical protein
MITVNSRILGAINLILVTVILCQITYGKVIYVDDNATGINDGTNWTNAYMYLQDALADANDSAKPVEIRVAQGTYKPDHGNGYITGDQHTSFLLKSGVMLKGGFAGVGGVDPDTQDTQLYTTVLSGDLSDNDNRYLSNFTENSHHVIICTDANETAVLEGFTITGGYAKDEAGGGMFNDHASPTVRRCVFFDNYASTGGGMYNNFSSLTVTDCMFDGNLAEVAGGMYNHESAPVIKSTVFHENRASMLGGGGLYCVESDAMVINCLFIDNEASWGGGMHTWKGSPTLINCTFSNNRSSGWGAGMNNEIEGHATIKNCIFWGNIPDQIRTMSGGMGRRFTVDVTYSDIQGGFQGEGNIDIDPFFADPVAGDYHLKSYGGRCDPVSQDWVLDYVNSPCVDKGDPNSPVAFEPSPNGGVINMEVLSIWGPTAARPRPANRRWAICHPSTAAAQEIRTIHTKLLLQKT